MTLQLLEISFQENLITKIANYSHFRFWFSNVSSRMHSGQNIEYSFPSQQAGKEMALATKKVKHVLLCFERFILVNN